MNTENGEDTTNASPGNQFERLDACMSQFDVRFTKLEDTLHKLLTAARNPTTPSAPPARKRGHTSSSKEEGDLERWDEPGSGPDECTRTKTKHPRRKREGTVVRSDSSSEGEINDDDDDTLSLDCQDDDLLKEKEQDLDNKEKTADKVADSMAEIINKRFGQGLSETKLKKDWTNTYAQTTTPNFKCPKSMQKCGRTCQPV